MASQYGLSDLFDDGGEPRFRAPSKPAGFLEFVPEPDCPSDVVREIHLSPSLVVRSASSGPAPPLPEGLTVDILDELENMQEIPSSQPIPLQRDSADKHLSERLLSSEIKINTALASFEDRLISDMEFKSNTLRRKAEGLKSRAESLLNDVLDVHKSLSPYHTATFIESIIAIHFPSFHLRDQTVPAREYILETEPSVPLPPGLSKAELIRLEDMIGTKFSGLQADMYSNDFLLSHPRSDLLFKLLSPSFSSDPTRQDGDFPDDFDRCENQHSESESLSGTIE